MDGLCWRDSESFRQVQAYHINRPAAEKRQFSSLEEVATHPHSYHMNHTDRSNYPCQGLSPLVCLPSALCRGRRCSLAWAAYLQALAWCRLR